MPVFQCKYVIEYLSELAAHMKPHLLDLRQVKAQSVPCDIYACTVPMARLLVSAA